MASNRCANKHLIYRSIQDRRARCELNEYNIRVKIHFSSFSLAFAFFKLMHAHPMELFSHGALHGGSWRSPYARYPAVGRTATTLGLLAPFRFSAALLES